MKRTTSTFALVVAISILAVGTFLVNVASANFIPIEIGVQSPKETTYATHEVPLTFRAFVYAYYYSWYGINYTITSVFYSVDGKANVTMTTSTSKDGEDNQIISAEMTLSGLSEGSHEVVVYAVAQMGKVYSFRKSFAVDTTQPSVSILSIENRVYDTPDVALNFTTSETCSQIKYSLDGQENVTVNGNTTLSGLSNGAHNVTVYAWDAAGNVGFSETATFTTTEPEPPAPFPTAPVAAASIASVAGVGAGLLVFFKKRKRQATNVNRCHQKIR